MTALPREMRRVWSRLGAVMDYTGRKANDSVNSDIITATYAFAVHKWKMTQQMHKYLMLVYRL